MTESQALAVLSTLQASFGKELPVVTVKLWAKDLQRFEFDPAMEAVRVLRGTQRFFPSLAELIEAVVGEAEAVPDAADAWAEVLEQVRAVGYYGHAAFSHPAIANAVTSIGWHAICLSDEDDWRFRETFVRTYGSYEERYVREQKLGRLESPRELNALMGDVLKALPDEEPE